MGMSREQNLRHSAVAGVLSIKVEIGTPRLEVDTVKITNFEEEYTGDWYNTSYESSSVKSKVENMRRGLEEKERDPRTREYLLTTALVHLMVTDRNVREIPDGAMVLCGNLKKVTAPFVEEIGSEAFNYCHKNLVEVALPNTKRVGWSAFADCWELRRVTLPPDADISREAFSCCLSLEVLAAAAGFEVNTGDKCDPLDSDFDPDSDSDSDAEAALYYNKLNDPTVGIAHYLRWRNASDSALKECKYTFTLMFKLCEINKDKPHMQPRATPNDPIMQFLVERGEGGVARTVLSFMRGEERGKGDLRRATKAELLAVGLELKVLREVYNSRNKEFWGVQVDDNGEVCVIRKN